MTNPTGLNSQYKNIAYIGITYRIDILYVY